MLELHFLVVIKLQQQTLNGKKHKSHFMDKSTGSEFKCFIANRTVGYKTIAFLFYLLDSFCLHHCFNILQNTPEFVLLNVDFFIFCIAILKVLPLDLWSFCHVLTI